MKKVTYKIVRQYQRASLDGKIIKTGLTLAEAQKHCHDPETCSTTCTSEDGKLHTQVFGDWFDGYEEEK